ncbi:Mu transposase domain-containing protein [Streptomyces lydicus]|uniref:Mu transposase domain-containing protein n=1 Tax=Streptomyces lydicus TaxID=47763 RepID=UPI0037971245
MRSPVIRRTSTTAQPQNALLSSRARFRRCPLSGSSAQRWGEYGLRTARRSVWPPAVNSSPGPTHSAAFRRAVAALRLRVDRPGQGGRVDRYSQISVRTNRYSVPVRFRAMLRASELVVYYGRTEIARHERLIATRGLQSGSGTPAQGHSAP